MLLLLAAAASVVVNLTNDSKREEVRGSGLVCYGLRVWDGGFRLWGAKPMPQKSLSCSLRGTMSELLFLQRFCATCILLTWQLY